MLLKTDVHIVSTFAIMTTEYLQTSGCHPSYSMLYHLGSSTITNRMSTFRVAVFRYVIHSLIKNRLRNVSCGMLNPTILV